MRISRYVPRPPSQNWSRRTPIGINVRHEPYLHTLFLILVLPLLAIAAEWTGKVVGITDGDTIRVLHEGRQVKIRLQGIDCPEKGQAFGAKAKQATSDLTFGKSVTVKEKEKDRYGRTVAEVILPDGSSLNRELVRLGFAWWYQKYSKDKGLGELEAEARQAKRGLWADAHPMPPWEWRESERERKTQTKKRPARMRVR